MSDKTAAELAGQIRFWLRQARLHGGHVCHVTMLDTDLEPVAKALDRVAELELERDQARACMLANTKEIHRADGIIGELRARIARLEAELGPRKEG